MARSYRDSTAARRARVAPGVGADRAVFEQAYDVAMQVVELREKHGLTQAQLAELSGIDQGDISRIERGTTSPTARTLQRVADARSEEHTSELQPLMRYPYAVFCL